MRIGIRAGRMAFALLAAPAAGWAQCALCRTALTQSPEGQKMTAGFNAGIIFLFAAPFVIAGGIALYLFRAPLGAWCSEVWSRRSRRRRPAPMADSGSLRLEPQPSLRD